MLVRAARPVHSLAVRLLLVFVEASSFQICLFCHRRCFLAKEILFDYPWCRSEGVLPYISKPSVFFGCPKFAMLALRIDFRLAPHFLEYLVGVVLRSPGIMFCCVHFAAIFFNSQVSVVYLKFFL